MNSSLPCLILAGGIATRMRPHTEKLPKALLPICGEPFAHYQLQWLAQCGITEVIYSVGFLGDQIRAYVGNGEKWGLQVSYVDEGENLRGTGGAVRLAAEVGSVGENFLVTYGDSFLPIQFQDIVAFHRTNPSFSIMAVYKNQSQWDQSNVIYQEGWVKLYDKFNQDRQESSMDYIDYGLSILNRDLVLSEIPANEKYDLGSLFYRLSRDGKLRGFVAQKRFYEIGSPSGWADFEKWIMKNWK